MPTWKQRIGALPMTDNSQASNTAPSKPQGQASVTPEDRARKVVHKAVEPITEATITASIAQAITEAEDAMKERCADAARNALIKLNLPYDEVTAAIRALESE